MTRNCRVHCITYIGNLSISEGIVPEEFKKARVKPLYKKNSTLDVGNYRLVSILCVVSKILERAVYVQLESFLVSNNIMYVSGNHIPLTVVLFTYLFQSRETLPRVYLLV